MSTTVSQESTATASQMDSQTAPNTVNTVSPNLENIMHVPLQISVELGRVQLPLHMVARLGRGAVVDMQKEADSSVDICANGKVFAKGEIVSAEGKLGVRILEVTPASDRIRSLG
ncbi:MAG: FliM/FliN family flagellar motor switch protein [Mariprofundaceae bacterium]|nr:FliM/FliN family flagellar motor switch protein [Mariprofundaceae bacterium]